MLALFKRISKRLKRFFKVLVIILILIVLLSILSVLLLRWFNPIGSTLMVERKFEAWLAGSSLTLKREWRDWDDISDHLKLAVIAAEDQKFPAHHGFDTYAIKQAIEHNAKGGSVRGASTITQQVAKNLYLWSGRSWVRKGLEVWFTAWIEILWTKERTLEIYLNSIEWGNGIFGAEAASQYYFSNSAKNLTIDQATAMAAVLPNPNRWSPSNPTAYIKQRSAWVQKQISNLGGIAFLKKLECNKDKQCLLK